MTKTEVIQRLQKDLGIPRFQAYIEDKDYSEEEYDQLKKDFESLLHQLRFKCFSRF